MRQKSKTVLSLLSCAILLTGCGTSLIPPPEVITEIKVEKTKVPESLLTCPSAPAPPAANSQRDVALYILDLWDAGEECRTKLQEVRNLVEADTENGD